MSSVRTPPLLSNLLGIAIFALIAKGILVNINQRVEKTMDYVGMVHEKISLKGSEEWKE